MKRKDTYIHIHIYTSNTFPTLILRQSHNNSNNNNNILKYYCTNSNIYRYNNEYTEIKYYQHCTTKYTRLS